MDSDSTLGCGFGVGRACRLPVGVFLGVPGPAAPELREHAFPERVLAATQPDGAS